VNPDRANADTAGVPRLAAVVACALAVALAPAAPALATAGPALAVDVAAGRHPISPDVYGMNYAPASLQTSLGLTADRWGGNATSRYNWTNNTHNTGSDWYFENIVRDPGDSLDSKVAGDLSRGVRPVVTVPMTGWVAKDSPATHPFACGFTVSKYGAQTGTDSQWDPDCGNGLASPGGAEITGNDPLDTSVAAGPAFVKTMVEHLVATHGPAATTGVRTYALDNEPALWDDTHRDVHPAPVTYDQLRDRSVATAKAVKAADAAAAVSGPGDWGWCAYFYSPADSEGCGNGPDRTAHGGVPMAEWYLAEMKAASATAGKRLLDVFDEHYYPQATGVALASAGSAETQALRLRSTRSLWDPTYTDESWIGGAVGAPPIRLIPWMREIVAARYPGTRTMVSEYDFGGHESMNGALAQADVLGIFGRERLDAAMLWGGLDDEDPGAYAFRMYREYDGSGGRFGDTSVRATSGDQGRLAAYAAQRSSDGAVTVMVVNKTGEELSSPVGLSGASFGAGARVWRYSAADLGAIQHLADVPVTGGAVSASYPANSITLLVIPTTPAPAAVTLGVSPKSVVYGATVTVTGRLVSGGAGVPGRTLTLQGQRNGTTTWPAITTAVTGADGRVRVTFKPSAAVSVRWVWAGDASYAPATQPAQTVVVAAKVTSTLSTASMPLGSTARIYGAVTPAHPGTTYWLQRWYTGIGWRNVVRSALSPTSRYSRYVTPAARGTYLYRIHWRGAPDHAPGTGRTLKLTVT